jgi:hypothetical protein
MTSSIMHSCNESDDSLRITSVEVEVSPSEYTPWHIFLGLALGHVYKGNIFDPVNVVFFP